MDNYHLAVYLKLTQHCKSPILKKNKKKTHQQKKQDKGLQKDVREGTAISDVGSERLITWHARKH